MPIHQLKLLARKEIARNTIQFTFEKPANLTFKPGQYAGFTLLDPPETDAGGITRRFSLLSTPDDDHLSIAMRIQTSAYKRVLNALPLGKEVKFAGPTGAFTLHEEATVPAVFLAGGIGITPFYSMITHATRQHSPQPLLLFYGNQTLADSPFIDELQLLAQINPNFKLIPVLVAPESDWSGESGFITHTLIKKYVPDFKTPIYYICGSSNMVTALQETLMEMEIDEKQIKVEDFPGY